MTAAQRLPEPAPEPAPHPELREVQHIWMPQRRSLCDLASQVHSPDGEQINREAASAPLCEACSLVLDMLDRFRDRLLTAAHGERSPSTSFAIEQLRGGIWSWSASSLRH